jgi:hypothetical protein
VDVFLSVSLVYYMVNWQIDSQKRCPHRTKATRTPHALCKVMAARRYGFSATYQRIFAKMHHVQHTIESGATVLFVKRLLVCEGLATPEVARVSGISPWC